MASLDSMPSQDCVQHNVHRQPARLPHARLLWFPGVRRGTHGRWRVSGEPIKSAAKTDWYDDGLDSCQIAEGEVVWRATALEGLRSFRLSVLTACARR